MKAWYDDIDAATLQRIKTYSAFNDPKSKNLMIQTMYEYKQEEVEELETQIEKMKNWCNCKNYQQCLIELAEQGKGMKPSECCVNCKKWEIKEK